jgi:hypothetical protein
MVNERILSTLQISILQKAAEKGTSSLTIEEFKQLDLELPASVQYFNSWDKLAQVSLPTMLMPDLVNAMKVIFPNGIPIQYLSEGTKNADVLEMNELEKSLSAMAETINALSALEALPAPTKVGPILSMIEAHKKIVADKPKMESRLAELKAKCTKLGDVKLSSHGFLAAVSLMADKINGKAVDQVKAGHVGHFSSQSSQALTKVKALMDKCKAQLEKAKVVQVAVQSGDKVEVNEGNKAIIASVPVIEESKEGPIEQAEEEVVPPTPKVEKLKVKAKAK